MRYRPLVHFHAPYGWMNDPNGLLYHNGYYHLYYQCHPFSLQWNDMHWGHAVSTDLFEWHHQPIALKPHATLGFPFSGSVVIDHDNRSGLFDTADPSKLIAMYTSCTDPQDGTTQQQSIATSTDDGTTWSVYPHNPVIANPTIADFRDPNVLWYAPHNRWNAVITAGHEVRIYASTNCIDWTECSRFGADYNTAGLIWECASLVQLPVYRAEEHPHGWWHLPQQPPPSVNLIQQPQQNAQRMQQPPQANEMRHVPPHPVSNQPHRHNQPPSPHQPIGHKWMLYTSMIVNSRDTAATAYFIGEFDGATFTVDPHARQGRPLDYGSDYYAPQGWHNTPDRSLIIGWMAHGTYIHNTPAEGWRGVMSLPRQQWLVQTDDDTFLCQQPVDELAAYTERCTVQPNSNGGFDYHNHDEGNSFMLSLACSHDTEWRVRMSYEDGTALTIQYADHRITIDRATLLGGSTDRTFIDNYRPPIITDIAADTVPHMDCTIIIDHLMLELFVNRGRHAISALVFPAAPLSTIGIDCAHNSERLHSAELYRIVRDE